MWPVDAPLGDIARRHIDIGCEIDHDLQDRPREDRDLGIVFREGSGYDAELALRGIETEQLAKFRAASARIAEAAIGVLEAVESVIQRPGRNTVN